jgi:large subunit ribosomal protein L30e
MGSREALKTIGSSKLVICSNSLSQGTRKKIEQAATSAGVPVYNYDETSFDLGRLCNRPFRISVLAINSANDSEISALLEEINKGSTGN